MIKLIKILLKSGKKFNKQLKTIFKNHPDLEKQLMPTLPIMYGLYGLYGLPKIHKENIPPVVKVGFLGTSI